MYFHLFYGSQCMYATASVLILGYIAILKSLHYGISQHYTSRCQGTTSSIRDSPRERHAYAVYNMILTSKK